MSPFKGTGSTYLETASTTMPRTTTLGAQWVTLGNELRELLLGKAATATKYLRQLAGKVEQRGGAGTYTGEPNVKSLGNHVEPAIQLAAWTELHQQWSKKHNKKARQLIALALRHLGYGAFARVVNPMMRNVDQSSPADYIHACLPEQVRILGASSVAYQFMQFAALLLHQKDAAISRGGLKVTLLLVLTLVPDRYIGGGGSVDGNLRGLAAQTHEWWHQLLDIHLSTEMLRRKRPMRPESVRRKIRGVCDFYNLVVHKSHPESTMRTFEPTFQKMMRLYSAMSKIDVERKLPDEEDESEEKAGKARVPKERPADGDLFRRSVPLFRRRLLDLVGNIGPEGQIKWADVQLLRFWCCWQCPLGQECVGDCDLG